MNKLKVYIHQQIDLIIQFYILTIKFVDYLHTQDDQRVETKRIRTSLKRIRSMSYKGLQILFQLFDHEEKEIFPMELIDQLWSVCVSESYLEDLLRRKKQREDIVHLLKLAVIWSITSVLKQRILDGRNETKDLVKCLVDLLTENISNENKQLIIEFIWNIMQIDRRFFFLSEFSNEDLFLLIANDSFITPHYDALLTYLTRVSSSMMESKNSMSLTEKEFDILLILSSKQSNTEQIEQLCSIFFRLLRQNILSKKKKKLSKKSSEQNLNISILKVLQNLIINIENPIEKYLHQLPILCAKIIPRDQRIELIPFFQLLINQSSTSTSRYSQTQTTRTIEFFSCIFSTIWYLKQLIELNSWNMEQIDEPDYERRLNSYKDLTKEMSNIDAVDKAEYLCLFYHCLYELHYSITDLSLREYASQCIHLFLQQIPSYQSYLLTEIRVILKQSIVSSSIRHEFLRHLAFIVDINTENDDLNDLKRLRNSTDIEIDFFQNITHVQNHRRLRALKRLKLIHNEQNFRVTTIHHYLLPMICSFINDVINDETQDYS